ncbi:MAG: hypothetical protein ACKO39_05785, partial [Chthoniobacterales bacterium]
MILTDAHDLSGQFQIVQRLGQGLGGRAGLDVQRRGKLRKGRRGLPALFDQSEDFGGQTLISGSRRRLPWTVNGFFGCLRFLAPPWRCRFPAFLRLGPARVARHVDRQDHPATHAEQATMRARKKSGGLTRLCRQAETMIRLPLNAVLWAIAILALVWIVWLVRLWSPEQQAELHTINLLARASKQDWAAVGNMMAPDYRDAWGHDTEKALTDAEEFGRHFFSLRIGPVEPLTVRSEKGAATV